MKEIVSYHIGQAGVQIGNAIWELISMEHTIDGKGERYCGSEAYGLAENLTTFYTTTPKDKYVPRALFVDLEPNVIDEIRTGQYRELFHPGRLLSSTEDAASNFARGFFTVGKLILGRVQNETRKLFEGSDFVQGILINRSLGGGTGSGLTSSLFDILAEYSKTPKIEIPIYPSPTFASCTVEPYNTVLSNHFCIEDTDLSLLFDNEALYNIYSNYLSNQRPNFCMINRLIAQVVSSITASLRFESVLSCDLSLLQVNLVPYPRIHFPLCNFGPLLNSASLAHHGFSTDELTRSVFEPHNQMVKISLENSRYMSCALFYRGFVNIQSIYRALSNIKKERKLNFVDWCPTGFKIGINHSRPAHVPNTLLCDTDKNLTMLTNTSAIGNLFRQICQKFYLLYSRRAFLHWYVSDGMEENEFTESLFNITALAKDFEEITVDTTNENLLNHTESMSNNYDNSTNNLNKRRNDSETLSRHSFSSYNNTNFSEQCGIPVPQRLTSLHH